MNVSVVILTLDEEINIGDCLDSVAGFEDVHVLDCGSTDRTEEIVAQRGIPLHRHPFESFGSQRNWAIENVPTKYPWQFHLDADERLTPELAAEMTELLTGDPAQGGFRVASKLMFAGRWLRYAGSFPNYQVRLFHRDRLRFVDHGHGQREQTAFPIGQLKHAYLHLAFSKGLDHWFAKHAVYARREAEQAFAANSAVGDDSANRLWNSDPTRRRRALKRLVARLPGRYFLRLFYMLAFKRAFLDGPAGVAYAHMVATYEAMIDVHLRLLRHGLKA